MKRGFDISRGLGSNAISFLLPVDAFLTGDVNSPLSLLWWLLFARSCIVGVVVAVFTGLWEPLVETALFFLGLFIGLFTLEVVLFGPLIGVAVEEAAAPPWLLVGGLFVDVVVGAFACESGSATGAIPFV